MKGLHIEKNKIAIIGFGISGMSAARYFLKNNVEVDIFEDKKESEFNRDSIKDFVSDTNFSIYFSDSSVQRDMSSYDFVMASPGVPLTHTSIMEAKSKGIEYVTDINIFLRIFRAAYPKGTVISVTGSNGKSTTVSLLHSVLLSAHRDVYLGGNIGTSPLDFFDQIKTEQPIIVLETSSYQLEYMKESDYFDIACILNLSDNHLNRYGGKKELYAQAKLGGISPQYTDVLVNLDDEYTQKYILPVLPTKNILGVQFEHVQNTNVMIFENNSIIYAGVNTQEVYVPNTDLMNLKGLHNVYNCAFVCGILHLLGIKTDENILKAITQFSGLIHRIQYVDTINSVVYINDSKSTSPDATAKALETIGTTKNIILISGGNDKDISYDSMQEMWGEYVEGLILLPGTANTKLKDLAQKTNVKLLGEIQTMQEAIDIASQSVVENGVVLLSPATDSHASFKSFEDRGNQFIQCVQNLKN